MIDYQEHIHKTENIKAFYAWKPLIIICQILKNSVMKKSDRFNALTLIICFLVHSLTFNALNAQTVTVEEARLIANRFYSDRLSRSMQPKLKNISSQNLEIILVHEENKDICIQCDLKKSTQNLPLYYVFNIKNNLNIKDKIGFVIVSADQRIPAILGYSFSGEFPEEGQPEALKDWMNHYKEQIIYIIEKDIQPEPKIIDDWRTYSSDLELKSMEQICEVEPVLTTVWSQYGYYNNLCPSDLTCTGGLNGHVWAGCVAVAMAQIMKYWNYPATNNPIPGYTSSSYGWQPDIGVTHYNWSSMPDNVDLFLTPAPSTEEIDAVSTIIYHCGVAVQMNYSPSGSGAGSPLSAFMDYFKYSSDIQDIDKDDYTDTDWLDLIKNELDNQRPVYYSGYENESYDGGHSFVCEGYQDIDYFYFNWGLSMGGAGNGYFYLSDLTPGSHNFNFKQWAIIHISPSTTLVDADGNYYDVVEIGDQVWMAENLKTTKYNDGISIQNVTGRDEWYSLSTPAYCWYDNNEAAYKDVYGALYNWYTVETGKLCPAGWHVPSDEEWTVLFDYLGGTDIAGGKLKETGTEYWDSPNAGATNESGFSALPGGCNTGAGFGDEGAFARFWSTTEADYQPFLYVVSRRLCYYDAEVRTSNTNKICGNSVRCLKDAVATDLGTDLKAYPEVDLAAYPNPFSDHVYFDLQLLTDSKVRLEIYDINGSLVATVYNDLAIAHVRYRFKYIAYDLPSGTLSYRLIINEQQIFSAPLIHR